MAVSKLYITCGQTLLPVIMFNYHICLYNNVCEWNGNKICLNYTARNDYADWHQTKHKQRWKAEVDR